MPKYEVKTIKDSLGNKIGEAEFTDGKPNGFSRHWSKEGTLVLDTTMKNGEYHGPYHSWWDNGKPKEIGTFLNGKRIGKYQWYDSKGELIEEQEF